jgi:hypothetical protein
MATKEIVTTQNNKSYSVEESGGKYTVRSYGSDGHIGTTSSRSAAYDLIKSHSGSQIKSSR